MGWWGFQFSFLLGMYLGIDLLGHMGTLCSTFKEIAFLYGAVTADILEGQYGLVAM